MSSYTRKVRFAVITSSTFQSSNKASFVPILLLRDLGAGGTTDGRHSGVHLTVSTFISASGFGVHSGRRGEQGDPQAGSKCSPPDVT